jgi:F420-0:gamma-glutamyl ligase
LIKMPDYVGPMAFGVKMGVILPGMDVVEKVFESLVKCSEDGLLAGGDVVCVTESVVARAQNNYVNLDRIAQEIREKLKLEEDSKLAVIFPIASRNRFSMIMKGIARAVPKGEVVVQLSFPTDEVGNVVIAPNYAANLGKDPITEADLIGHSFKHPLTGVDYINLYREVIASEGAKPTIILSNNPLQAIEYGPDGIIVADIHRRHKTLDQVTGWFENCITLDQICNEGEIRSEWGLLGSNMSAGERLKLAPRDGQKVVEELQTQVKNKLGIDLEVMIYGDGAYLDPSSGIYELADPRAAFAATGGLDCFREGLKYKFLADQCFHDDQKNAAEIEVIMAERIRRDLPQDSLAKEGTTPRKMEDVLASLADLVSGSADAGTPVVIVKGFLR